MVSFYILKNRKMIIFFQANKLKNNNILEEKLTSNEEVIISNHPVELIQKTVITFFKKKIYIFSLVL